MIRLSLTVALAAFLLAGCKKNPPPDWQAPSFNLSHFGGTGDALIPDAMPCEAGPETHGSKVDIVNDRQVTTTIESITSKLIEAGKSTKATDLAGQLKREHCAVTLAAAGNAEMTCAQIYEKCASSVLVFSGVYKCNKCSNWHAAPAAGFVISERGIAVTNYHVLEKSNNETYVAMTHDGKVFPVKEVLAASQSNDLVIVQLDLPEGVKLRPLALAPDALVGTPVTLISHPDKRFYSLTTGIISRYHTMGKGNVQVPMLSITADFARGSSGAPVLDSRGAVVGIVASTHSVYYNTENGKQENLQTVFKQCVPTASLMALIEAK